MEAMEFLEYVKTLPQRTFTVPEDVRRIISGPSDIINREFFISDSTRVLERLTFNPGVIRGGEKANVVAQFCDLELEMRIPWGCNSHDLVQDLAAHAHGGKIIESSVHDPSLTDPGCDLVSTVCREVYKVHGGHVFPIVQWAASDARHLRSAGFMVAEYGPGEIATLHAVDERVRIDSLKDSEEVYHGILESYANSS
jgi:succinyl-diaminopimelate desuccinylase